jgi:sec-independent protein translocase protein TatC
VNRPERRTDDLFEKSTMTFGEHLEELRWALGMSILWTMGGLAIGLFFASHVLRYVSTPFQESLKEYHAERTLVEMGVDPLSDEGVRSKEFLVKYGYKREIVFVSPEQLRTYLEKTGKAGIDGPEVESGAENEQGVREDDGSSIPQPTPAPHSEFNVDSLRPLETFKPANVHLQSLKLEEGFFIWLKAGFLVGILLVSPMVFRHLWEFVAAGLYPHERKYVYTYLPFSLGLFWAGALLAFFVVLPMVLTFFLKFNAYLNVDPQTQLNSYVSFVLILPLGFGVSFQLPLVMLLLERIGLFKVEDYLRSWRVAVMVIFIVSMVLTPGDASSMLAMALALVALYFLGIGMCKYMPGGTRAAIE